eukprot:gene4323-7679_t
MSFSSITKKEIKDLIQNKSKYLLIDVRTPDEYNEGAIETSKLIPLQEFPEAMKLEADHFEDSYGFKKPNKEDLVIIYCRSGQRSTMASTIAEQLGYKNIKNYEGSMLDWVE